MSLRVDSSASEELWMRLRYSAIRGGRSGRLDPSAERPITAFIGVRISWLMLARKKLLARFAASASTFARASASSTSTWFVRS